jgi:16S rRNA (cytidine1402-2'-O)-methyltransferase
MGTLFLVATPIGHLDDVTLRALRVLREAQLLFAEDTRRTRILLEHHGVAARPVSLHAHNEAARCERALAVLREGASVALVSDAGTPLLSDPGERLVAAALGDGHRVEAVPGASAVLTALAASGLPAQPFTFLGFAPRKAGARRKLLEPFRERVETLVLFESPRRVGRTLAELAEWLGSERRACVARELTKVHEELARGSLGALAERFADGARGEVTLVVEGAGVGAVNALDDAALDVRIRELADGGAGVREIATTLAAESRRPRREVYSRVIALRDGPAS